MMRLVLAVLMAMAAALGVQSWRLSSAHQKIDTQRTSIQTQDKKLSQKNSQLIALNILTQTSSRAQTQLYAAAEKNAGLLQSRQQRIEELKRENEDLRRWADSPLPDPVVRLRQRPAITGGESYRQWLSENHPLSSGGVSPAH